MPYIADVSRVSVIQNSPGRVSLPLLWLSGPREKPVHRSQALCTHPAALTFCSIGCFSCFAATAGLLQAGVMSMQP